VLAMPTSLVDVTVGGSRVLRWLAPVESLVGALV